MSSPTTEPTLGSRVVLKGGAIPDTDPFTAYAVTGVNEQGLLELSELDGDHPLPHPKFHDVPPAWVIVPA